MELSIGSSNSNDVRVSPVGGGRHYRVGAAKYREDMTAQVAWTQGIVTASFGGFTFVRLEDGKDLECKPRGKLKLTGDRLLVGDKVRVTCQTESTGTIEEVLPRTSMLIRPPVANVDQVILVFAAKTPDFNPLLADRFLMLVEANRLDCIICINKSDLAAPASVRKICRRFEVVGYPVMATSAIHRIGQRRLRGAVAGKVSVVAGPSGAGKSALLNMIEPGFQLVTGEVSEKIGRGRHTTRHARLMPARGGGLLADTPGFTQLDLDFIPSTGLADLFPEMGSIAGKCRFRGCLHSSEPGCAVREAIERGELDSTRYESYLRFLDEIRAFEKRRFH